MKNAAIFSAALAGFVCLALSSAPVFAKPRLTPQQQLDKALAGRVAGKPVDCIDPRINNRTRIIDRTAIIYGDGRTIYLQQPENARALREDDVLVTELRGSGQLCSIDLVRLVDPSGGWSRGSVSLNKFVPYTHIAARK